MEEWLSWQVDYLDGKQGWLGWGWEDNNRTRGTTEDPNAVQTEGSSTDKDDEDENKEDDEEEEKKAGVETPVSGDGYDIEYTSSAGITYKEFKQYRGSYALSPYWGGDIYHYGCGPTAIASLASGLLGSNYTPLEVANEMDEKYGFTSYVLATPGQPLYYTKTLLDRTLQTQKPQLVVLETNAIYRSFQPFSPLAEEARKVFPIFEYHDRWKSLRVEDFSLDIHYTYNNVMKGYRFNNNVQAVTSLDSYMKETDQAQTIPKINLLFLNMIIDTCEKAEIPVLLLSTPSPVNWNMGKHLAVADYARDKGLTYVDLNLQDLETPIDWKMDTRDAGDHLNDAGALKVTHFLGNYLYDHFSLPDHRQDKDYLSWKESLSLYHQMVDENRKKMKQ